LGNLVFCLKVTSTLLKTMATKLNIAHCQLRNAAGAAPLAELTNMFKQTADVKLDQDIDLPKPKLRGGKPMIVTVPSSDRTQK
jgi:hypothetical protein